MSQKRAEKSDLSLVAKSRKGYMHAIETIVAKYETVIYNFGLKMCGQKQDAEDVAQDTFLSAFKSLSGFRGEAKLKNWLFRIAANACMKKRRKKKHEPDKELSLDEFYNTDTFEKYEIPDCSNSPDNALMQWEIREIIDEAVRKLPPDYRMVFTLRDQEGFSTDETADIVGVSPQLVKTRLHRARLSLRKTISDRLKSGAYHGP